MQRIPLEPQKQITQLHIIVTFLEKIIFQIDKRLRQPLFLSLLAISFNFKPQSILPIHLIYQHLPFSYRCANAKCAETSKQCHFYALTNS